MNPGKTPYSDLGFSPNDRHENIRRIAEVAALFADSGIVVLAACISPYGADRENARRVAGAGRFVEIYTRASVEQCENRDPKGLYQKARAGEIKDFTGVSAPYEEPRQPDVIIDTVELDVRAGVDRILRYLEQQGLLSGRAKE